MRLPGDAADSQYGFADAAGLRLIHAFTPDRAAPENTRGACPGHGQAAPRLTGGKAGKRHL